MKEYVDGEFLNFATEIGILIDTLPPYTPWLNGVSKCTYLSLLEESRAVLFEANLPKNF